MILHHRNPFGKQRENPKVRTEMWRRSAFATNHDLA